jgi:hypothetical protein
MAIAAGTLTGETSEGSSRSSIRGRSAPAAMALTA